MNSSNEDEEVSEEALAIHRKLNDYAGEVWLVT